MLFDYINDKTGFANGDVFENESQVIEYFTVENMHDMFDDKYVISQEELDEMSLLVIRNRWHIADQSKVFSIRININDSIENVNNKIDDLTARVRDFIS